MGVTLLFPGQGSQYVGMGKNLKRDIFNRVDEALGFSISNLCTEGPEEKLKLTEYTQPAIVTHSIALFEELKVKLEKRNIKIDRVLGHSVGEYSALVAAGSLSVEAAAKAVNSRGKFMQNASPLGAGKMYAVLRVPTERIQEACLAVSTDEEKVMPANFNEPSQTVISGHANACDKAVQWLKENYEGKQMAIPLKVSAPFHSSLMKPAEKEMKMFLDSIEFKANEVPYIANIDAQEKKIEPQQIKENLTKQICGSVMWTQSIEKLPEETVFIEVGPGKVLTGLNKKINKNLKTFTLDQEDGFNLLEGFLDDCNL